MPKAENVVDRVRRACLALPDTMEKLSHGEPTWFVRGRVFVMLDDHHHGADRLAIWCTAPEGAQRALVEAEPEHYFIPPYVGKGGWIAVRLDSGLKWPAVKALIEQAHATTASKGRR